MRASLLLVPLLLSCGGGSSSKPRDTKATAPEVSGKGTRGFDEHPEDYGANEYGEFGYDDGYYDEGYGEGYGGDYYGGEDYPAPPPSPPSIVGTWTRGCEAGDKDATKLTFVNTDKRWELTIESYADTACAKRTKSIKVGGPYAIGEQSPTVTKAWTGTFSFDFRDVTVDDAKTAKAIGKACGVKKLKAGATVSILDKGCAKLGFKPLADCASDFDLVALQGTHLTFGERPADNDLCTEAKRPAALAAGSFPYVWPPTSIPECDAYLGLIDQYLNCPSMAQYMPADMLEQMKLSMPSMNSAEVCKPAVSAMTEALKQMGC